MSWINQSDLTQWCVRWIQKRSGLLENPQRYRSTPQCLFFSFFFFKSPAWSSISQKMNPSALQHPPALFSPKITAVMGEREQIADKKLSLVLVMLST